MSPPSTQGDGACRPSECPPKGGRVPPSGRQTAPDAGGRRSWRRLRASACWRSSRWRCRPAPRRPRPRRSRTCRAPSRCSASNLNLLWVVIGAVLVIFMQAGLRPGRDRLLPGQARRPRGDARTSPSSASGSSASSSSASRSRSAASATAGYFGVRRRRRRRHRCIGSRATGCSCGRAAGRSRGWRRSPPASLGLLPLHGRLHGHRRHDPDRVDGRALEVEAASWSGASSAARSTTRSSRPGPGAAAGSPRPGTR